jgi:furin
MGSVHEYCYWPRVFDFASLQVVTTDLHHQCTSSHTGTSASAPLAAGICALALESNRELTWRDMQHIVVRTARPANLKSLDWKVNGVGSNGELFCASSMFVLRVPWFDSQQQQVIFLSPKHPDCPPPPQLPIQWVLGGPFCDGKVAIA